ncbi:cellulose binding domain-containing protein [Paractinoplanes brasiliensis]|uniref:Glucuronoarabinoxylan endo-1,4-beta-xylanase n=1 Tax=Paractinoplanes brasiliensis TaxID=52695 RepID=A0A4R6J844_9ACTN|nr:cellulose binding domain-containing protein [Actinoplanes brasiliensis]TDO31327.1 glucuronoarabinoxylan endo-1,4-beta-xylanase [Actinoplanes brasiliensis]GID28348.1 glucuronoxylanase xynC [Actinoplanes brasiliensis]
MTKNDNEPAGGGPRRLSRRTVLTTMGALPVATVAASVVRATEASAAAANINPSATRQTIKGFGAMVHAGWIGDLTAAQRTTAFSNGEGQLGFSILRIPVGENSSDWSRDLATAQRAVALGGTVFASPWNPPASMIETFTRNGQPNQKRLRASSYGAYAQHLNDFTTHMRNNGVNLYAISVQNEPDYASEWTWWTSAEIVKFLKENAGSIGTRIIAPESFQYIKSLSDPILNDAAALANVDILGAHLYGTSYANFPYPLFKQKGAGKELWMTEVYYPNSNANSGDAWPEALDVGEHIHRAMVDAEFQAYVWWYLRRSYGPMREDGQISKRGAMMAHFARFVRPGYVRIDATANPAGNVYVSAYRNGTTVVIVAVNKNTSSVSQQFALANTTASGSVSNWLTDSSRNVAPQNPLSMSNGSLTVTLPARSVMTFVTSVSGTSSPSPTVTPVPTDPPAGGTGPRLTYTTSAWSTGLTASIKITNTGSSAINGWTLTFTLPSGQAITSGWNATYSPASGQVSARNLDYNGTLAPGASVELGFQATHTGNTGSPTAFTLNGVPCVIA